MLIVAVEFHAQVKSWITINDPHSVSYGYSDPGPYAPGVNGGAVGYYLAAHTLILSHARAYRLYDAEFRSTQGGNGAPAPRHSLMLFFFLLRANVIAFIDHFAKDPSSFQVRWASR